MNKMIYNVFKCYSLNKTKAGYEECWVESYSDEEEAKKHVEFIQKQIDNGDIEAIKTFYEKTEISDKFNMEDWDDCEPIKIAHLD